MVNLKTTNERLNALEAKVAKLEDVTSPGGLIAEAIFKKSREAFTARAQIQKELDELRQYEGGQIENLRALAKTASEFDEFKKYCEETRKRYAEKNEKFVLDVSHITNSILTANKRADELNERVNSLVVHCTINTVAVILALVTIVILR